MSRAVLLLGLAAQAEPMPEPVADVPALQVEGAGLAGAEELPLALEGLLDDAPAPVGEVDADAPTPAWAPWPLGLGVLGGLLLWMGRKRLLRRASAETGSELRIVGRTALGTGAGLAVVEVRGRDGNWRRLVVGTGDGSPSLVADLGEPEFGFLGPADDELAGQLPDHGVAGFPPLPPPADLTAAMRAQGKPPELDAHAKKLIDEVLGERRGGRKSSFKTFA